MRIKVVFASREGGYPPEEIEKRKECLRRYVSPGVSLDFSFLPPGSGTVFKEEIQQADFDKIIDAVVARFVEAEREGFDACTLFGTADVGVEKAKRIVKIPVVGWGKATYCMAMLLAERIGVIVYEDSAIAHNRRMVEEYHADHMVVSIESVKIPLSQMAERKGEMKERFIEACRRTISRGAEVIYPHGVSMVPLHYLPEEIEKEIGVPVLNAMEIGIRTTELIGSLHVKRA